MRARQMLNITELVRQSPTALSGAAELGLLVAKTPDAGPVQAEGHARGETLDESQCTGYRAHDIVLA
jgi:hypothetical protein